MSLSFESMQQGYANLWAKAKVTDNPAAMKQAKRIIDNEAVLKQVEDATDVPWWLVGAWLYRESDLNFNTYLGNGQSLHHVTTVVPQGRGPFPTFLAGAIDAIKLEGLYKLGKDKWTMPFSLWATEKLNGFGYVSHNINSPYLWSWTDLYTHGKFTSDHGFDPNFKDPQGGVAAILKALFEIDPTLEPGIATKEKPKMADTQVTAKPHVDISGILNGLETVIGFLPVVAKFVPQLAPAVPFIPIIKGAIELAAELENGSHDPQEIASTILKHLQNIGADIQAVKGQMPGAQQGTQT